MALLLAQQRDFSGGALHDLFEAEAKQMWKQREFLRGVTASLAAAPPEDRYSTVERLYRLDHGTIQRLQADRLSLLDRWRVRRALRSERRG
jgi:lycopene beta-cyclase